MCFSSKGSSKKSSTPAAPSGDTAPAAADLQRQRVIATTGSDNAATTGLPGATELGSVAPAY